MARDTDDLRSSPAEAAFASSEIAECIASHLAACATPRELARCEGVCASLHRALTPHWRALCAALSAAATETAGASARWRRLHWQLQRTAQAPLQPPTFRCRDVMFLVDVRFRGQPVYAGSFTPLPHHRPCHGHAFAADAGREVVSAAAAVTAGDLYDWPTQMSVTVYARRMDGAMACLARDKGGSMFEDPHELQDESDSNSASHTVRISMAMGSSDDVYSCEGVSMELKLRFEPRDAASPLFYRAPDFFTRPHANKPRHPYCWVGYSSGDWHGKAPIPEAELANRVVVSPYESGTCAVLRFEVDCEDCSCEELCTALGVMRWEAP